jgi:hypothetical protein
MPPVRDGIFCFKALRIHSYKRENKKCRSRRRQTAAVFFFDSATPFRDHRSAAEVIPLKVRSTCNPLKALRIHSHKRENKKCRSRRRQTAAAFFFDSASPVRGSPERSGGNPRTVANLFAKPPLFIIFKKLIKTKWLLLQN